MRFFFTLLLIIHSQLLLGQLPSISISDCFGGSEGEGGKSIIYTKDNGYLIVGQTISYNGDVTGAHISVDTSSNDTLNWGDIWVIKLDFAGNILWEKCFGGMLPDDGVLGIEVSGGYLIGATIISWDGDITHNNGESDYWIFKIDYSGNLLWQKSYGGSVLENLYDIEEGIDGNILVIGDASSLDGDVTGHHGINGSDAWLLKLDSMGNLLWEKCFGGSMAEIYQDIETDTFGNIYLITSTSSSDYDINCHINGRDNWLTKLDPEGNILWTNCFGGTWSEFFSSMRIYESNILLSGRTASSDGDLTNNYGYYDAWLLLVDTSGSLIFSKTYGGSLTDQFYDALFTIDNKIIAAGSTKSSDFDVTLNNPGFDAKDAWIVCLDSIGNLLWQNTYGGSETEEVYSIDLDSSGNLVATGFSSSPNDGDIFGYTGNPGVTAQVWLIKFDFTTDLKNNLMERKIKLYPNPFTENLNLSINNPSNYSYSLFDLFGRQVNLRINIKHNSLNIIPNQHLNSGIYVLNISNDEEKISIRVIKN
jgi:hypothetical protein